MLKKYIQTVQQQLTVTPGSTSAKPSVRAAITFFMEVEPPVATLPDRAAAVEEAVEPAAAEAEEAAAEEAENIEDEFEDVVEDTTEDAE